MGMEEVGVGKMLSRWRTRMHEAEGRRSVVGRKRFEIRENSIIIGDRSEGEHIIVVWEAETWRER